MRNCDKLYPCCLLLAGTLATSCFAFGQSEASSSTITALFVDVSKLCHDPASNGDSWDYIWADDDNLYSFACDGRGYGKQARNLNFNKLTGDAWNHLSGSLVNSMDEYGKPGQQWPNHANWKITGGDCIDGVLYAFVENHWYGNQTAYGGKTRDPYIRQTVNNMSLIKSTDKGRTWTRDVKANYEHPMWRSRKFSTAVFFKYGQNGGATQQDDQDKYVYAISNDGYWNCGSNFYLGRALRSKLADLNAADWQYFSHGQWSGNIDDATPVDGFPNGQMKCTTGSPIWLAGIRKYVTVTWYDPGTTTQWHYPENVTFAFYQADHPWGPWSYIGEKACSDFLGDTKQRISRWYGPSLSPRFITANPDGSVTAILTFSGQLWDDKPESLYKNNSCPITYYTTPQLQAVKMFNDTEAKYSGVWLHQAKRGYGDYQDDVHVTTKPGAYVDFAFTGRGIEVLSEKYLDMGDVEVLIDGVSQGTFSLYQDPMPRLYQVAFYRNMNLSDGAHTIRVVNKGPDAKYCLIDGFRVYDHLRTAEVAPPERKKQAWKAVLPPPTRTDECEFVGGVPLGGIGTGTFEVRGDGSFRQWLIVSPAAKEPISLQSLLHEMTDRNALARWPAPPYNSKEFTSYDRRSVSPDQPGWFANHDQGNFLRTEDHHGRKEYVMMDADGPGAIVCFFKASTDPAATVRIYLDGGETPVIEENLRYLLGGGTETQQERSFSERRVPPFPVDESQFLGGFGTIKPPLAGVQSLGCNLYLPIPYARHCKVTYDKPGRCYYRINYRTYPSGTPVETFTLSALKTARPVVEEVGRRLLNPAPMESSIENRHAAMLQTLKPGSSMAVNVDGPAAVRSLGVRIDARNRAQAQRSTVLRIAFDGMETVWCPVGDFFAGGIGVHRYRGWTNTVDGDGAMRCYWIMPFNKSCRIELVNLGEQSVEATLGDIGVGKWSWDRRSMYFHANWRQQYPILTKAGDGTMDWNYIETTGQGVYAGDTLVVHNGCGDWWGEGDEKIYVDGETFPSHFGTGTEDYYGYSRGGRDSIYFESPFISHPQIEGDKAIGYSTITRVRSLDAIPFSRRLKVDMEIWHWKATTMAYAATTYWYGRPGATCNRSPDAKEAASKVLEETPPTIPLESPQH